MLGTDGSGVLQDGSAPIHTAQGLTEWFEEYGNDVNHMLWLSGLKTVEHLRETVDRHNR